ncbi:MAG: hypothetical protein QM775_25930 [Pirellulales bacterium]
MLEIQPADDRLPTPTINAEEVSMAKKKRAVRKNSLVANINRRKQAGKSRSKRKSTITPEAYDALQEGWPKKRRTKRKKAGKSKK